MADYNARIAPFINQIFYVTSPWWTERINPVTGQLQIHRGLDIATPSSVGNAPVYSIVDDGIVIQQWHNNASMGNALIIKSQTTGIATLFMHLDSFVKNLGDSVKINELVGYEGTTGQSTGIHLHVEMQDMTNKDNWTWSYNKDDYLNPTEYMGFPNLDNISIYYDGSPYIPPTPIKWKKSKFNFLLFKKKDLNKIFYKN